MEQIFGKSLSIHFMGDIHVRNGFVWMGDNLLSAVINDNLDDVRGLAELTLTITPVKNSGLTVSVVDLEEKGHDSV